MTERIIPTDKSELPKATGDLGALRRKNRGKFVWRTDTDTIEQFGIETTRLKNFVEKPVDIIESLKSNPEKIAIVNGFNYQTMMQQAQEIGPIIEVAGPSKPYRMQPVRGNKLPKMFISNVVKKPYTSEDSSAMKVDYLADTIKLPHPNNSIGGVFVSNFNPTRIEESAPTTMMAEFARVLRPGGVAVMQGMDLVQYQNAVDNHLEPMTAQLMYVSAGRTNKPDRVIIWAIFQKPI